MKRNLFSIFIGLITAIFIFFIAESINHNLHPVPKNINFKDSQSVKLFFENQPILYWLIILFGWMLGSFFCGFFIKLLSRSTNKKLAIIAASLLTLSGILNFYLLPHPTWFIIVGLLIFFPSTIFGFQFSNQK